MNLEFFKNIFTKPKINPLERENLYYIYENMYTAYSMILTEKTYDKDLEYVLKFSDVLIEIEDEYIEALKKYFKDSEEFKYNYENREMEILDKIYSIGYTIISKNIEYNISTKWTKERIENYTKLSEGYILDLVNQDNNIKKELKEKLFHQILDAYILKVIKHYKNYIVFLEYFIEFPVYSIDIDTDIYDNCVKKILTK